MRLLTRFKLTYDIRYVAIEMIASYGMPVGASVFDTCVWIGRFKEHCLKLLWEVEFVYRKEEKMILCNSMKAKDSNITQALIDLFAKDTPNKGKEQRKSLDISTDSRKTYGKRLRSLMFSILNILELNVS